MIHTGIRAYVFQCTYGGASWIDNPSAMITDVQNALATIRNFSYLQLKVANVKNSSGSEIQIEIVGITYLTLTSLTTSQIDDLIDDLNTALLTISSLYYLKIDICTDVFSESPTANWPGSWKRG